MIVNQSKELLVHYRNKCLSLVRYTYEPNVWNARIVRAYEDENIELLRSMYFDLCNITTNRWDY